jgi:hypothetical protein
MKRFPPYGRELFQMRCAGKAPTRIIQVVFGWDVAKAYYRLVLADETPASELDFRGLAGLPVQISFHNPHSHRVDAVVQAILAVQPSFLCTFNIDLAGGDVPAWTIIKELQEQPRKAA